MKQPSCLMVCFACCKRPPSEADSSHFSVSKAPVPSGSVLGGFLSSFMSWRSCSRGTCDNSATDSQKLRMRTRGDADIVTLETARYLELFANTPKNDEASTVLSDVREGQDSMRSVRTASENQFSRSSTFTGRASREPSRLGGNNQPQPLTSMAASGNQRFPVSIHRRGASDASSTQISPGRDGQQLQPGMHSTRKMGSSSHAAALSPFTNKTRAPTLANSRSRSDRISPSTAALLLPAPSVKTIARAHTTIPSTAAVSTGGMCSMTCSTSVNEFSALPLEGGGGDIASTAASGRPRDHASAPPNSNPQAQASGIVGVGCGRPSRLHTGSGSPVFVTAGATAPSDLGVAAQQWVQNDNRLASSATAGQGNRPTHRGLPRRPSILFTRDGDVTVTGLPPSCLTAGRAPRCRGPDGALGCMNPMGMHCPGAGDMSAPVLCPALFAARASFDSASSRIGGGDAGVRRMDGVRVSCVKEAIPLTVLLSSRSNNEPVSRGGAASTYASDVGLSVTHIRRQQQRRHGGGEGRSGAHTGVSMSCGANAKFMISDVNPDRVAHNYSSNVQFEGFLGVEREQQEQEQPQEQVQARLEQEGGSTQERRDGVVEQGEGQHPATRPRQVRDEGHSHGHHEHKRVERTRCDGPQSLATSSSEIHRCEWGSVFAPSRFSDSSRLTQGNTTGGAIATPATASLPLNTSLDHYAAANIDSADRAGTPGRRASTATAEPPTEVGPASTAAALPTACVVPASQVDRNPPGMMMPLGFVKPYAAPHGSSLLAMEARDVTSALNRLQEACLAAVAQGDMRSQRLCRRVSTELPRLGADPSQMLLRIGCGDAFGGDRSSSIGPLRIVASLGSTAAMVARPVGGRTDLLVPTSPSVPRLLASDARTAALAQQGCGGDGCGAAGPASQALAQGASVTLAMDRSVNSALDTGAAGLSDARPWGGSGFGGDRLSPDTGGIVIDGEMLGRGHFASGEPGLIAEADSSARGQSHHVDLVRVSGDEGKEELRNPALNALLRSDFLHDTYDAAASEDDDDGVVEYRYGGFELGGDDNDCGFARQASFMEAVRKCGMAKAAASAVGLDPSQAAVVSNGGPLLRSATVLYDAGASRHGLGTAALQRKGSCLAVASGMQPALT